MKEEYPVTLLCACLGVPTSSYYAWAQRTKTPGLRALEDQQLARSIEQIHTKSRATYGSPRVVQELRNRGQRHGRNRVSRLMKEKGLCGRQKRRYRVQTTDSNHELPIAPNRLAEAPRPAACNQIWATDITYIETGEGWLFLAGVLDLYSRKLVGWAMSDRVDTKLVLNALQMAHQQRGKPEGVLIHSDRGVQYASAEYRSVLKAIRAIPSMSRKGNCYDNAAMESFWSTLKLEHVYRTSYPNRSLARESLFGFMEIFYNRSRAHSSIGYMSPAEFESKSSN